MVNQVSTKDAVLIYREIAGIEWRRYGRDLWLLGVENADRRNDMLAKGLLPVTVDPRRPPTSFRDTEQSLHASHAIRASLHTSNKECSDAHNY